MKIRSTIRGLFLFLFSLNAIAGSEKLAFQLPEIEGVKNKITSFDVTSNVMVVVHKRGIAVSTDQGFSFKEASIEPHPIPSDFDQEKSFIHIDSLDHAIYVRFHNYIFKSQDSGKNFKKINNYNGEIHNFTSMGNDVAWARWYYCYGHPVNNILISHNGGEDYEAKSIGDNENNTFSGVRFIKGKLITLGRDGNKVEWFVSNDHGRTFLKSELAPEEWLHSNEVYSAMQANIDAALESIQLPAFRLLGSTVEYKNPAFNSGGPTPGIYYEVPGGVPISSELVPRLAAFQPISQITYYSTHSDVWELTP